MVHYECLVSRFLVIKRGVLGNASPDCFIRGVVGGPVFGSVFLYMLVLLLILKESTRGKLKNTVR